MSWTYYMFQHIINCKNTSVLIKLYFEINFCFRVCLPPEEFLLVIFSTLHTKPEFYQCGTSDGKNNMEFELSTCHEVIQLPKVLF